MHSTLSTGLTGLAALASVVSAFPFKLAETANCAAVSGTFEIENYKLYPENLDWDPIHCKLYIRYGCIATLRRPISSHLIS